MKTFFFFFFLEIAGKISVKTYFFFFWRALALVSLVLGLGLEHSYPWPRECLSSERLSLALASDFFVSLASSLVSSTPPLVFTFEKIIFFPRLFVLEAILLFFTFTRLFLQLSLTICFALICTSTFSDRRH